MNYQNKIGSLLEELKRSKKQEEESTEIIFMLMKEIEQLNNEINLLKNLNKDLVEESKRLGDGLKTEVNLANTWFDLALIHKEDMEKMQNQMQIRNEKLMNAINYQKTLIKLLKDHSL